MPANRKLVKRVNKRVTRSARVGRRNHNRPVARVRAKATVRGKSASSASITNLRFFSTLNKRFDSNGKIGDKWWLESLKTFAITVLKILATTVLGDAVHEHLRKYPLPISHPLQGRLLSGAYVTGAIVRLMLGPEDLIGDSDFIEPLEPASTALIASVGRCHYRQAKIEWVKVVIIPSPQVKERAGMMAACLLPVTLTQAIDDFKVINTEKHDFHELLRTPGVVYKTATSPTTLTYSPRPGEYAYNWIDIGSQQEKTDFVTGGSGCLYLDIGFKNWASDSEDLSSSYSPSNNMFDVTVESRVHLREYDECIYTRVKPWALTDQTKVSMLAYNKTIYNVPCEQVFNHHGMLLHEQPLSMMELH